MTTPAKMPPKKQPPRFRPPRIEHHGTWGQGVYLLTKPGTPARFYLSHDELRFLGIQLVEALEGKQ